MTQPDVSALARKWKLEVDATAGDPATTWTPCNGLIEFKPNLNANLEDDSTYDDEGYDSVTKTALGWVLEAKFIRRHDIADVEDYDAGQELLRACAEAFGSAGVAHVRWYDRNGGPEAYHGYAEVSWAPDGGNNKQLETVVVTLTGKGRRIALPNPAGASS